MSESWWNKLATHFRSAHGFPLPTTMRGQAEREVLRLAPGSLDDAIDTIVASASLSQELVDALGMGLTWFNREGLSIAGLVDAFRQERRATRRTTFWAWSAGCSMGQEPYSLAMALLEAGAQPIILATDINREHLRIAAKGQYRPQKLDMIPPSLLDKYFRRTPSGMRQVRPELRRCITFEKHNFAIEQRPPAGWSNFDAVVCRNALIYYEIGDAIRIASSLCAALRPQGQLVLGAVERPLLNELQLATISAAGVATVPNQGQSTLGRQTFVSEREAKPSKQPAEEKLEPARAEPRTPAPEPKHFGGADLQEILRVAERKSRKRDQSDACIEHLTQALVSYPLSSAVHLLLGLELKRSKRIQEALAPLRAARFLDSKGWLAVYHLAICLEEHGETQDAQLAFRDTLTLIQSGHAATSMEIPGIGDLDALATTVAEHCTHKLTFARADAP